MPELTERTVEAAAESDYFLWEQRSARLAFASTPRS
jgi:hypothetical protein